MKHLNFNTPEILDGMFTYEEYQALLAQKLEEIKQVFEASEKTFTRVHDFMGSVYNRNDERDIHYNLMECTIGRFTFKFTYKTPLPIYGPIIMTFNDFDELITMFGNTGNFISVKEQFDTLNDDVDNYPQFSDLKYSISVYGIVVNH